jgi:hypothetical protein
VNNERYPKTSSEQLDSLPDEAMREAMAKNLYVGLVFLMESFGITVDKDKSSYRVKSMDRIIEKIERRRAPLRDLIGVRLIIEPENRSRVTQIISDAFPLTPKVFPDGKPYIRDYSNPTVREYFREKHNPHTSPFYSALHINVAFLRDGKIDFAEVQVMSHEELKIYNHTREEYIKKRLST